jgi:hypothetical protein
LQAAISGLTRRMQASGPEMSLPTTPGGQVDDHAGAGLADRVHHGLGHVRVPARHVAEALLLHAQVHMHDRGPALKASRASAAIWAGVTGTGCCLGLVSTPVSAQVRMALSWDHVSALPSRFEFDQQGAGGHRPGRRPGCTTVTRPAACADSHISIFMASTQTSGWPSATASPTATGPGRPRRPRARGRGWGRGPHRGSGMRRLRGRRAPRRPPVAEVRPTRARCRPRLHAVTPSHLGAALRHRTGCSTPWR